MSKYLSQLISHLKNNGKYWIVFTGDSITSCEWVHPNWRDMVIYVLQDQATQLLDGDWRLAEWGVKGFNFAYDGATTKDIHNRIDEILLVKPHLVISLMGGNDPVLGISVDQSVSIITSIADKIIDSGAQLVWANSTPAASGSPKNQEYQPYAHAFMELPERDRLLKIDMFNLYQEFPIEKFFTFISEENPIEGIKAGELDTQHPNQLGNAYIAQVILDKVFGIVFNPERYIQDTIDGVKLPCY